MPRLSFTGSFLAAIAALSCGAAYATNYTPPGPTTDFPSADSYYPPAATRAGQQGTVTIHVCVDVHGKLTEPPTLAESSGSDVLDDGAVSLANAGDGHYHPALQDGVPTAGCGGFRVKFKLRGSAGLPVNDPRFPTIGARITKLNDEMTRRMQGRISELGKPGPLNAALESGDPAAERALRQYARSCDSFIDETVGLAADFLDDIDYLGESPDVPKAEQEIFKQEWPNYRSALVVQIREMVTSLRDLVRIADELGDYVAFSVARRSPLDGKQVEIPVLDPQLDSLRRRARAVVEKLQNNMKAQDVAAPSEPR